MAKKTVKFLIQHDTEDIEDIEDTKNTKNTKNKINYTQLFLNKQSDIVSFFSESETESETEPETEPELKLKHLLIKQLILELNTIEKKMCGQLKRQNYQNNNQKPNYEIIKIFDKVILIKTKLYSTIIVNDI